VVARYRDGRVLKGSTADFLPHKDRFHLALADAATGATPVEVRLAELKAVFFVRDFAGDPGRHERQVFDPAMPAQGRKVPADPASNNERWFIIAAATREVTFL
jgi:hypothetical protein